MLRIGKEQKTTVEWFCTVCDGDLKTAMSFDQVKTHLTGVHGLVLEGLKCQENLTLAMDGTAFAHNQYDVTIGGIKLVKICRTEWKREKKGSK